MLVLDVGSFWAAGAGGIRTYYEAKARWMPSRGVDCHFAVPGARASIEQLGDGWLHRVPGPPIGAGYRCFADVAALWRLIRELDPDVVELGSHYVLPQVLAPALRRTRAALVGFYHADFPSTYVAPALGDAPRWLRRLGVGAAWAWVRGQHARYRATLAGSHGVASRLAAAGVPRVRWVGLGVDLELFRPGVRRDRSVRRLAYLGRLAAEKEVGVLLDAAPRIARATGARITIGGAGPLAPQVAEAAARGEVEALGLLDRGAAAALLAEIDAVIVPGRHETFGLAAAEAMACGTPVIAADRGGACELVERSGGGLTFAAGSPDALLAAVARFYGAGDAERAAMGARAAATVRDQHGWEHVFDRVQAIYDEVAPC